MRRFGGLLRSAMQNPNRIIQRKIHDIGDTGVSKVKVSFAEQVGHLVFMFFGITAFPAWVLLHITDYQGPWEDEFADT